MVDLDVEEVIGRFAELLDEVERGKTFVTKS